MAGIKIKSILLLLAVFVSLSECNDEQNTSRSRTTVTRTELKVSRSIDPEKTQTLNVLTKNGGVATLIVKKRDEKDLPQNNNVYQTNYFSNSDGAIIPVKASFNNWSPIATSFVIDPQIIGLNSARSLYDKPSSDNSLHKASEDSEPARIYTSASFVNNNDHLVPNPVDIRSDNIYVKPEAKKSRSVVTLGNDGIPVVEGVRVPDDEADKRKVWRNARVINGELMPYEKNYKPARAVPLGELVYSKENTHGIGPFLTTDNFATSQNTDKSSVGPFTVDDNKQKNIQRAQTHWNYVGNRNNYVRFNTENGFGPFTKADNSRVANAKLIDYIKEINEREAKRDYFSGRTGRETTSVYDTFKFPEKTQLQRRMLHYQGSTNYPNSQLYTSTSTKLKPVNFIDGVRTPVLQYAHPELGVQPVKIPSETEQKKDTFEDRAKLYFSQDVYNSRPTYDHDSWGSNTRPSQTYMTGGRRKDVGTMYRRRGEETPALWTRMTASFQSGLERVRRLARPVLEPIVEATHKIGQNLGFTTTHLTPEQNRVNAQDRVDIGTGSILPALGLVAGGAALGWGAAAMGRFLDVGLMRSTDQEGILDTVEMQHKRALETYGNPDEYIVVMEDGGANQRHKRDAKLFENSDSYLNIFMEDDSSRNELRRSKRLRRAVREDADEVFVLQEVAQDIDNGASVESTDLHKLAHATHWGDTPCAKRIFCEVMSAQSADQIALMEKKMDSFLRLMHPVAIEQVSTHLYEVMDAIRQRDCSRFFCFSERLH